MYRKTTMTLQQEQKKRRCPLCLQVHDGQITDIKSVRYEILKQHYAVTSQRCRVHSQASIGIRVMPVHTQCLERLGMGTVPRSDKRSQFENVVRDTILQRLEDILSEHAPIVWRNHMQIDHWCLSTKYPCREPSRMHGWPSWTTVQSSEQSPHTTKCGWCLIPRPAPRQRPRFAGLYS